MLFHVAQTGSIAGMNPSRDYATQPTSAVGVHILVHLAATS